MRFALGLILAAATLSAAPAEAEAVKWRFGAAKTGSAASAEALGGYAAGCLAGGEALPITGPGWQAMRLERGRNWGHPEMLATYYHSTRPVWTHPAAMECTLSRTA